MDKENCQIFIAKLSPDIGEEDLRQIFRRYGKIREINLKRGFGFIVSIFLNFTNNKEL
jgi:hypothetical protein